MASKTKTVLVLRTCRADMTSCNKFVWPRKGKVECPDWRDDYECGHGLHGMLWGEGDGSLLSWEPDAAWLVVKVLESDIRTGQGELMDKCKFPRGEVVFCGDRKAATDYLQQHATGRAIVGAFVTSGDGGTICIRWLDGNRYRLAVGYVGEDGILPGVAYRCDAQGRLVPVDPAKAAEVAKQIADAMVPA